MKVNVLVTESCSTLCNPGTVVHQTPLFMAFSRQEYWSGLPFSSPGDLPNPGIKPRFPALQADSLPSERPGKPNRDLLYNKGSTALYSTITQMGKDLKKK